MKALDLGAPVGRRSRFTAPADLVTEAIGIFGIRGSGKSSTSRTISEELAKLGLPVVIIDPKGDWWGIKSNAKGNAPGLPFIILGGEHSDGPLEPTSGELVADFVIDNPGFYVLDLSDMRKSAQRRFYTDFAERLYWRKRRERDPLMVVVDEADLFAPQNTFSDKGEYPAARMVGASEDLVRRGRQRGIGSMWPTQRPASLHTGVRSQVSILVAMRLSGTHDFAAIDDWVKANGTKEQRDEMMANLASLETGEGYVWSPHFLQCFERIRFRMMETFDSFATPKAGQRLVEPKVVAKVDLAALSTAMKETIEKAKENDPRALKKQVADLQRELLHLQTYVDGHECEASEPEVRIEHVMVPQVPDAARLLPMILEEMSETLAEHAAAITKTFGQIEAEADRVTKVTEESRDFPRESAHKKAYEEAKPRPAVTTPRPPRPVPTPGMPTMDVSLGKAERQIVSALYQFGTCSRNKLSFLSGYHANSKGFVNALSALRTAEIITRDSAASLTAKGIVVAESMGVEPLPRGRALLDHFKSQPKVTPAMARILDAIYDRWIEGGPPHRRDSLAEAVGYHPNAKGFANNLSRLRSIGIVTQGQESGFTTDFAEALS